MNDVPTARSPLVARLGPGGVARLAPHLVEEHFAPGDAVVREGDAGRDLYLVFDGRARVVRKGLDVGTLGPGAHFGELGLVTGAPRAASVVAATPLTVARLPLERFEGLVLDDPPLAVSLLRGVVDTLGAELTAVTDNLGALLGERSLPRRIEVRVATPSGERVVRTGTPVAAVLPARVGGALVVAALLDHKPVSLATPLTTDAPVAPLTDDHWEGQRVVRDSTGLLVLEAAARVLPECAARLGPSLGVAQRVVFEKASASRPPSSSRRWPRSSARRCGASWPSTRPSVKSSGRSTRPSTTSPARAGTTPWPSSAGPAKRPSPWSPAGASTRRGRARWSRAPG